MRVAIIDGDRGGASDYTEALSIDGDTCHCFDDGKSFLHSLPRESFDVCVVDQNLPGSGGTGLVKAVRERKQTIPALIVTLPGTELDVIEALHDSNDDFLVKPVRPDELRARLRHLVRRASPGTATENSFQYDRFVFNRKTLQVTDNGTDVELTQKEFQLAVLLLSNVGKPLSRGHIREIVWGRNSEVPSRTLDTHISRVRTKLALRPDSGYLLAPVYSYGYRLENLQAVSRPPEDPFACSEAIVRPAGDPHEYSARASSARESAGESPDPGG